MSDWNDRPETPLGGVGGTLGQRLKRSKQLDRPQMSDPIDGLSRRLFGEMSSGRGWIEDRTPTREAATPEQVNDFHNRAVREMVASFGGATKTLDREKRLSRDAERQELARLRARREFFEPDAEVSDGLAAPELGFDLEGLPDDEGDQLLDDDIEAWGNV
jgi:hypothetical protein